TWPRPSCPAWFARTSVGAPFACVASAWFTTNHAPPPASMASDGHEELHDHAFENGHRGKRADILDSLAEDVAITDFRQLDALAKQATKRDHLWNLLEL